MSAASTSPVRRLLSAFFFALGVALFLLALTVEGHAQSRSKKAEPPPADTQSVYYPDLCDVTEPGSWPWYLNLCFLTN